MTVRYEAVAVTGTYTDSEGVEKKRYLRMGVVIEVKSGLMLKLEAIPVNWDGVAFLNHPREKDGKPAQGKPKQHARDEDIPF